MDPPTEKAIWRNRAEQKTKALIGIEERHSQLRRSDLAQDAIKHIVPHKRLAGERYSGNVGDAAWDETEKALPTAEKRRKLAEQRSGRRGKSLPAVSEDIRRIRGDASKGKSVQKIDCIDRLESACRKKKDMIFEPRSSAAMDTESSPKSQTAESALLPEVHAGAKLPRIAGPVDQLLTTTHTAHSNDRVRKRSHPGLPGASTGLRSDFAFASSSKARRKSAPLPTGFPALVNSAVRLPATAHWYDPPLSLAAAEDVKRRMRPAEEYMKILPNQRSKAMAKVKKLSSSPKIDAIGTISSGERRRLGGAGRKDIVGLRTKGQANASVSHHPLRARSSYSQNSFLLKRTNLVDVFDQKRRTKSTPTFRSIHHGHLGKAAGGPRDAAHLPPREISKAKSIDRTSDYTYGDSRPHAVLPPSRKIQTSQSRSPPPRKKNIRFSQRLFESRNKATSLKMATERIKNHSREKGKTPRLPDTTRHAHEKIVTGVSKKKSTLEIPADRNMATDLRAYSQWPDDSGALKSAQGCLLPANYRFSDIPGFEWICPVRSCRRCLQSQKGLGSHFASSHHSCLLNDNCDGTFTAVGEYTRDQSRNWCPAVVESKDPLPADAPPMVEPRPPVTTWQRGLFFASQEKARSRPALHASAGKTVDEMMLSSSCLALSPVDVPGLSERSDLTRTPSSPDLERRGRQPQALSSIHGPNPSVEATPSEGRTARALEPDRDRHGQASHPPRDATQENWWQVRRFLTGRQFYPPRRGHFAALLSTPRSRGIVTRPGARFVVDQPKKVRLLIVHMTGEEPPVPCGPCARGRGPFDRCVAISRKAAGETADGIACCTNCARKRNLQRGCNVGELPVGQPAAAQVESPRRQRRAPLAPERRDQASPAVSSRSTEVDALFAFAVHALPPDGSLLLDAEPSGVRLCSLAAGKVMVEMEGISPFLIGPHGVFKLMPAMSAQVSNASEAEAVLHVSTVKT